MKAAYARLNLHLSKCHIVGNHMSRLSYYGYIKDCITMYWLIFLSEYKRARAEIKKCAADTVRLQKKVKKGELRVTDSSVSLADDRV